MNKNSLGITLFVASLCFIAFVYGAAMIRFNLWPSTFFNAASSALTALIEVATDESQGKKLPSLEFTETEGFTGPTVIMHADPAVIDNGYIFVDGGNNQLRSHCPEHGCIAWLIDRNGEIVHTWDMGPELVWHDIEKVAGKDPAANAYSVGAHLYANGDIVVTYQGRNTFPYGIGVARFDKDSKLLWKKENFAHHWLSVSQDGLIYVPGFRKIEIPYQLGDSNLEMSCPQGAMYQDVILVLDPDGNQLDEISIFEAFVQSGYTGAIFQHQHPDWPLPLVENICDPTHLNDVEVISAEAAAGSQILTAGDLLISLRSNNLVALIDGNTHLVKWLSVGRTVQQHSPRYLGNDQLLIFDNLGGRRSQGGSRLLKLDMRTDAAEVLYPPDSMTQVTDFLSVTGGHIALSSDNSRALVSLTRQGRTLEIELATGRVLWEYINSHEISAALPDESAEGPVYGRFATQTLSYVDQPAFELNGGR